jgi:hypothetical protein
MKLGNPFILEKPNEYQSPSFFFLCGSIIGAIAAISPPTTPKLDVGAIMLRGAKNSHIHYLILCFLHQSFFK